MPMECPCKDDCYCKEHSCKPQKIAMTIKKEDIVSKYTCCTHDIDSVLTQQQINRELERSKYSVEWLDNQSKLVTECLSHLSINERLVIIDYLYEKINFSHRGTHRC